MRIALALKSVPYEAVWLDLRKNDHLEKHYGDVTPTHQVPCLEIDGHRLFQSVPIIEYLDETRPTPPLLPNDPAARANVRAISELINSGIQPMHNIAVRRRLNAQFGATESASKEWCRYWIAQRLLALNRLLVETRGKYACGDAVTMADIFLYPQVMASKQYAVNAESFPEIQLVMEHLGRMTPFRDSHAPGA